MTTHPAFDASAMMPEKYVREYIAALSRSTQTPIEMPTLLALSIASAAVCNVAEVRGHGDHIEPAPIWALVLAEPAARKSAVIAELLRPITDWEKRVSDELRPVIAAAAQRRRIEEKRLRGIEDAAARCTDPSRLQTLTLEGEEMARLIDADPLPTVPTLLTCEPTPEALSHQMVTNGGRALLASAEGDALDIVQGRYSGSRNYGILLKGHAGDAVRAGRVGRPGDVIDRPALALALCVQPMAVRELWADPHAEGRGLLARFAVILPRDTIGTREVRPPAIPPGVRERMYAAMARLLTFEPVDEPVIITLDPDADAIFHAFQRRTEAALGGGDLADRRAWGGKLCGLALRIALTLHALSTWAKSGEPDAYPTIGAATMQSALAWAEYLAAAERHARAVLCESVAQRDTRRLVELVERLGGSVSPRELVQRSRDFESVADAEAALDRLAASGRGEWVQPEKRGPGAPRSRRFVLTHDRSVYKTPPGDPVRGDSVDNAPDPVGAAAVDVWDDGVPIVPPGELAADWF
ncbi:MAG: DUF3987 domain-containing protein [Phycisphaeraceae bacterium]|nr:DUF3987 domain-containing protein [Phycisphaeraceae bacterium]